MSNDFMMPSRVGRWTAWVPAMTTRALKLHLTYRNFPGDSAYLDIPAPEDGPEMRKLVQNKEYRVEFKLVEIDPNEITIPATIESTGGFPPDNNDVFSFLQAVVNEAAKLGIYATGEKNASATLAAVKDHLADMRALVFKTPAPAEPGRR